MQKWLSLLLFLASAAHGATTPVVLVFGDSLSAGFGIDVDQSWVSLLQSRLEAQGYEHRVINASISGETTEGGAVRIQSALDKFTPKLVILELGGNDGLRGFPPQRISDNLDKIVEVTKDSGSGVVLLGIRIPTNYGARYTEAFEGVYRDIALRQEIPWIEFFMDGVALNDELMQEDGIHPNAEAQIKLLDNAWPIIRQAISEPNADQEANSDSKNSSHQENR